MENNSTEMETKTITETFYIFVLIFVNYIKLLLYALVVFLESGSKSRIFP